jgi:hypothetical protein
LIHDAEVGVKQREDNIRRAAKMHAAELKMEGKPPARPLPQLAGIEPLHGVSLGITEGSNLL